MYSRNGKEPHFLRQRFIPVLSLLWACSSTFSFGANDLVELFPSPPCYLSARCGLVSPSHLFTSDITLDIGNNPMNSPSAQIKSQDKFQRKFGTCILSHALLLLVYYHLEHASLSSFSYSRLSTKTNFTTYLDFYSWSSSFWWFHAVR